MQAVRPVIGGELVLHAVERKLRATDAIAVAPDQGAKIGVPGFVVGEFLEAEHYVAELAPAIGHVDRRDDAAIGDELDRRALVVGERVEIDGFAVLRVSEWGLVHRAGFSAGSRQQHAHAKHGRAEH